MANDNKDQRGEHHRKIPVINPTRPAATVTHHPGLERTEEEDTYHVAHRIKQRNQRHDPLVKDMNKIQSREYRI